MAFDEARGVVAMWGGCYASGAYNDETWEWLP